MDLVDDLAELLMTMSQLVTSTRSMPATLPILGVVFKTKFPKWESSKINPEKVAYFSSPNPHHQLTTFYQQSTTNSPPKNHAQPPDFAKTPSKNRVPPAPKKSQQKRPSSGRLFASPGMTRAATTLFLESSREPWRCPIRANSPPTENGPAMSQTPGNGLTGGEWGIRTPDRAFAL
jgi:hypothetical protein